MSCHTGASLPARFGVELLLPAPPPLPARPLINVPLRVVGTRCSGASSGKLCGGGGGDAPPIFVPGDTASCGRVGILKVVAITFVGESLGTDAVPDVMAVRFCCSASTLIAVGRTGTGAGAEVADVAVVVVVVVAVVVVTGAAGAGAVVWTACGGFVASTLGGEAAGGGVRVSPVCGIPPLPPPPEAAAVAVAVGTLNESVF